MPVKKTIVISAVNLTEAGPLTILNDCLLWISSHMSSLYNVLVLVHNKSVLTHMDDRVIYCEYPEIKKSWFRRLWFEYISSFFISKKILPYLWFSLHDISPNVVADRRAVYCHNPSPFYRISLREIFINWKFSLFCFFYKFLYALNIHKNDCVIVQQDWIRERFRKMFMIQNIVVAYPEQHTDNDVHVAHSGNDTCTFFYPAFPRVFKNHQLIGDAVGILRKKGIRNFRVVFTLRGDENCYAKKNYEKYRHMKEIEFVGLMSREEVTFRYQQSDCILFPSKLETWGLPISEAKRYGKPIITVDLPYAYETMGTYDKAAFVDPVNAQALATVMEALILKSIQYTPTVAKKVNQPFARNWAELFDYLLGDGGTVTERR